MLQLLVDGGLVDEHVVIVLVEDHEVVADRQEVVVDRQESLGKGWKFLFLFRVCLLAWVIVADRQESLEVSELWSLVAVNVG